MAEHNPARREPLLQALRTELAFFDAGGYGRPFRSEWRSTLLLRDSPVCIDYHSAGRQTSCRQCPFFSLVPAAKQNTAVPCHHIPLDGRGNTVASIYRAGTQKELDERYRDWLSALTLGIK
jgi:hypothetical protein